MKIKIRGFEQKFAYKDFVYFIPHVVPRSTPFSPRFRRYPKGAVNLRVCGEVQKKDISHCFAPAFSPRLSLPPKAAIPKVFSLECPTGGDTCSVLQPSCQL